MAYHVSLVNTNKKDISSKLIINKEKFREFLFREFNMKEELNENGVLEFIEPSNKTERTYNHTVYFEGKKEEHLKQLIQAIWAKIRVFDFEINIDKYEKNKKGIEEFANDLIADFEGLNE